MADLKRAPIDDGTLPAVWVAWIKLLEAKIKELETRLAELEP
jgi:hypothetical protein